jgi:hypothetical protein
MTVRDLSRRERLALTVLSSGRGPTSLVRWARRTLEASDAGRAAYHALTRAEQATADVDLTVNQQAHLEAALFASLDGAGATTPAAGRPVVARLALVGAVTAAALFFVWSPPSGDELGELTVRGLGDGTLGVTVRCLAPGATGVEDQAAAGPGRPSTTVRCDGDGLLSFAFINTTGEDLYAMVVGVSEQDELRWYAPFAADGQSTRLAAGSVDQPLSVAADLAPMPAGERVVLRTLFSRRPLRASTVGSLVDQARARHLSPSRIDRLPLTGTLEARVELVVSPVSSTHDAP